MKKQHKHLFILFTLVCCLWGWENEALAVSWQGKITADRTYTLTQVSGTTKFTVNNGATQYDDIGNITLDGIKTVGGSSEPIDVTINLGSGTFYISGTITLSRGHLIIQPSGDNAATLKRKSGNTGNLFYMCNNSTGHAIKWARLDINGASSENKIIIHGNATWKVEGSNTGGWTAEKTGGVTANYPVFDCRAGCGYFNYVDFQQVWSDCSGDHGGVFRVISGDGVCRNVVEITDCIIQKCYSGTLGAVMYLGGSLPEGVEANSRVTIRNTTIQNCFSDATDASSGGGIFRTGGNGTADLQLRNCTLQYNKSNATGTINWNSGKAALEVTNCRLENNYTKTIGAAMALYSKATITGCTITGNYAKGNGGAIYYRTYSNTSNKMPGYAPQNGTLSIDATTSITNNTSEQNGGGLFVYLRPITCLDISNNQYTVFTNSEGKQYEVHLEINGTTISGNTAGDNGGGIYLQRTTDIYKTDLKFTYGTIKNNTAQEGGGIYVTSNLTGTVIGTCSYGRTDMKVYVGDSGGTISTKATVSGNTAQVGNGGGIYVSGVKLNFNMYANAVIGKSGTGNANQAVAATGKGGGVYFNGELNGSSYGSFTMNGGDIDYNTSKKDGAGIYINNGTCTIKGGTISYNQSESGNGGGIYVNPAGAVTTTINSTSAALSIASNQAVDGGGIYVNQGSLTLSKGSNTFQIDSNVAKTASAGNGGGIYAKNAVTITGVTISSNKAEGGKGGGIYAVAGGNTVTVQTSASIASNKAIDGAGLYAASGNITIQSNSTITNNVASKDGGGIYANNAIINVSATTNTTEILESNSAKNGGAIYAAGGTVNFSDGIISNNYASEQGGGLYIPATGKLTLQGTAKLTGNHVPEHHKGGGVYLEGVIEVGSAAKAASKITAEDNYAGSSYQYGGGTNNRNNIYLPDPNAIPYDSSDPHVDVITLIENGLTADSKVGFSVPHNFVPVIYCAKSSTSRDYLGTFTAGGAMYGVAFEDSEKYSPIHYTVSPYDPDHIYLSNLTWVQGVYSQPAGFVVVDGNVTISTKEGLAWLISYVNGLNGVEGGVHTMSGKTVTLNADVNMDEYSWVPIGFTGTTFEGTFNGNGHTVSGIDCLFLGEDGGTKTGLELGMFGNVGGNASINDVFLKDAYYSTMTVTDEDFVVGGVVAKLSGTAVVFNTVVEAEMESVSPTTIMGGLVGQITAGEVHSSSAMADMKGYTMGGLVGTNGGNLYNSFANPKFTHRGSGTEFVGGLAAVNNGTIQNDYVRFTRASSLGSAQFGQIVGDNNSSVTMCYHPTTYDSSITSTLVAEGSVTSTVYGNVVAPYLYNHSNDNLVGSTSDNLCKVLNNWVSTNNNTPNRPTCASWKRTTAGSYSAGAGNINGDYPIHKYEGYTCVASIGGLTLDYCTSLDGILERHASDNITVNLYANDATTRSTGSHAVVYIDEDVSLLQTASSVIEAYTCQTLKTGGSGERWHFLSSSLSNSQIGFSYGQDASFNWSSDPCLLSVSSNDDQGIMPSDILTEAGITAFDLYAFYEPEYHWINFKRSSNSHWHMNAQTYQIGYDNESTLTPGKGYLVSVNQDQLLQNRGTLNNGGVSYNLDYTSFNAWAGLLGYNLIGNPYQSYLDFSKFLDDDHGTTNTALFEGSSKSPAEYTYAVYDSETGGYLQYKAGSSKGSRTLSGYINPHQGFLVRVSSTGKSARFTNYMRSNDGTPNFRGEQPAYPLINLMVTDNEGDSDVAVLELSREGNEGAEKLRANTSKGWLYLHHEGEDYAILFRDTVTDYQPLWFDASEAGTYTLSWNTANVEFDELTLVDNIAGTKTDMLKHDSYSFESDPEQYASRFKIVIGTFRPIHDGEEPAGDDTETFAYMINGMLVVSGDGKLEIIDMLGRIVKSEELHGTRSSVTLPQVAEGVYVLRLTSHNESKTQKIVIE